TWVDYIAICASAYCFVYYTSGGNIMLTLIRNSLTDFKENISIYLIFEFIYSVFACLLIIPILTYTFNNIFMLIGNDDSLLKIVVYQICLSFFVFISLFIIVFLAMIVLFL